MFWNRKKKQNADIEVQPDSILITAVEKKRGSMIDIRGTEGLKHTQFIKLVSDTILNLAMQLIVRYNIDAEDLVNNMARDIIRTANQYKEEQEGKED